MDSSGHNSTAHSIPSTRGKTDIAWEHVTLGQALDGKKTYTCLYCGKIIKGGGINRMKQHLAGKLGEVGPCKKVPPDVKFRMEEGLNIIREKKKQSEENYDESNPYGPGFCQFEDDIGDDVDVQEIFPQNNKGISINEGGSANRGKVTNIQKGKGKAHASIGNYFAPRTTPGSQPTIKSAFASNEAIRRAHMLVAKFFYDACIPINAVNSIYFQAMFDAAIAIGAGYKVPTYHALRVPLLRDSKKEIQLFIDTLRSSWVDNGCTIMGDGWTDGRQRSLINFLVYCHRGINFVRSIDASDVVKNAHLLSKLFLEIIEWVGVSNVVHTVTDNGANYVAAGRLVNETYKTINWSPCAAHCLNLILSDIASMGHVNDLAIRASTVTKYVYNHIWLLSLLRKKKGWTEIVRPGKTRFATTFIALQSIHKHMYELKALVTSKSFVESRYAKEKKAKEIVAIILDNKFWNDCLIIVKIVEPLMRLLHIVDGDEKPSIGYVYEGMYRARIAIKKLFKNKSRFYKPYTTIVKQRWDRTLHRNIHAAAYWLNPAFQYDQASFCHKPEVMASFLDVIESKAICSKTKLLEETRLYRDWLKSFGRELALTTCKTTQPDEWWRLFGHSAPNLQKLAIQILSQTSSSSGCERNWSVFERIHTKKRNRLEHQRLNDLVYIHYNLRLQNRKWYKKRVYDPIDYETIDTTEFWIVEEQEVVQEEQDPKFLDYDELEKMLYEEDSTPQSKRQRHNPHEDDDDDENVVAEVGDDIDFGSFGNVNLNVQHGVSSNKDEDDDAWLTRGLPTN